MYPEPYFEREKLSILHEEIKRDGFKLDDFLPKYPDLPVYGLNIAFGWPLPDPLRKSYNSLYNELLTLGPDVYVYPYHQTHVTVMTLVNFKKYRNPTIEKVRELGQLVPKIISIISREISNNVRHEIKSFKIDVGPPVLLSNAVILPILNHTEEVFRFRKIITPLLKDELPQEVIFRNAKFIHSTILRFIKQPSAVNKFMKKFELIAKSTKLGVATISELLLTSETRPYMRGGEKLHKFKL